MDKVTSAVGLDVGGANLKAAHSEGIVLHQPFELWRHPDRLADALSSLLKQLPCADMLAVTMTGELCDCFESKRQGVHAILDAVRTAAASRPVAVWTGDGTLVSEQAARASPLRVAAANWLALAFFAGRFLGSGAGVLIDIGSTTTDITPLQNGIPVPRGRTDPERLRCQELIYTGVRRTPVCALLGRAGAAEVFATTLDVYLTLGMIPEDAANRATADGRPATQAAAHGRLARMLCADAETCSREGSKRLAQLICDRQVQIIRSGLHETGLTEPQGAFPRVILAGCGEFLARMVLESVPTCRIVSLAEQLGPAISEAACAFALARLPVEMAPIEVG